MVKPRLMHFEIAGVDAISADDLIAIRGDWQSSRRQPSRAETRLKAIAREMKLGVGTVLRAAQQGRITGFRKPRGNRRGQLKESQDLGSRGSIAFTPALVRDRGADAPDENHFTMSRTGEMRMQWCRFRGQKGNFG